jgi:hypothetical protein
MPPVVQLFKNFPTFYGIARVITVCVYKTHLLVPILCQINPISTTTFYLCKIRFILSTHLHLGLLSSPFPSDIPTNFLYAFLSTPTCAICSAYLVLLDLIILIIIDEKYESGRSSSFSFIHLAVTSSPLGPNILLSTLFSNARSLCSSLNVRDQV